jgi:EpsI family protein
MGNIKVRMGVVIGVLVAVQLGFLYFGRLSHPEVVEPQRPIQEFPMVVETADAGTWEGKDAKLDDRTFNESEMDGVPVSRIYSKDNHKITFLLGEYKQPSKGLYHNPMNCYKTQGFTLLSQVRLPLNVPGRDATISVSTWKSSKSSEKVIVAYWYELGDRVLFERQHLLKAHWAMLGKRKWPVMFKVLLEVPASEGEPQALTEILGMAQVARKWLGEVAPVVD